MVFAELTAEQLYEINGGCGICKAGGVIGGAATLGAIALMFTPAAPVIVGACIVGGILGYCIA